MSSDNTSNSKMQPNSDNTQEINSTNVIKRIEKPEKGSASSTTDFLGKPARKFPSGSSSTSYTQSDDGILKVKKIISAKRRREISNLFDSPPRNENDDDESTNEIEAIIEEMKDTCKVKLLSPMSTPAPSPSNSPSCRSPSRGDPWNFRDLVEKETHEVPPIPSTSSVSVAAPSGGILPQSKRSRSLTLEPGRGGVGAIKKSLGIQRVKSSRIQKAAYDTRRKIIAKILDKSVEQIKTLLLTDTILDENIESTEGSSTDDDIILDGALDAKTDSRNASPDSANVSEDIDIELLQQIHEKIATLNDLEMIQKVVDIVEGCGRDAWTTESEITFDFDLLKLSSETIQKIREAVLL